MMKILQLGKFYPIKGGVEKVMYDLMLGLSKRGITCDMLCASDSDSDTNKVIKLNEFATIFIQPTFKEVAKTKLSWGLISKLRNIHHNYDIIHIHHPDPMAALALFLSGYKGKVVLHWHSDILAQKQLLKVYKFVQNWLIKRADKIVVTSPNYLEGSEAINKFRDKAIVIPIGIEDPKDLYNKNIVDKIKTEYSNKKIVFSLGRLVPYKGFSYLIDSAKNLSDDYVILIGGSGPLREDLQKQIADSNLSSKVKLLGFITDEEVYSYFKACDIFCLTSTLKTEAFAIVQVEAMAYSKPVVSTIIEGSGVHWVNKHNVSGLTVEKQNSEKIAEAINNLCLDGEFYNHISQLSRKRYEEVFTIDQSLNLVYSMYNDILNS